MTCGASCTSACAGRCARRSRWNGGEGLPAHVLAKFADPERDDTLITKFREAENIKIVVAGGTAGRFSAIVPGWTFAKASCLVFRRIQTP